MGKHRSNNSGKCLVCGTKLVPAHWTTRKRVQFPLFCSSACKWQDAKPGYQAKKEWLTRPQWRWLKKRNCAVCGMEFMPKKPVQVYCYKQYRCTAKAVYKKRNWASVMADQRAWFKQDRLKDPEKHRAYVRKWRLAHPEQYAIAHREHGKLRKHRIRAGGGKVTRLEWEAIKTAQNRLCAHCHKRKRLTMDHIHPISKGGKHESKNIQALCMGCNQLKSNRIGFVPQTSTR